MSGAVKLDDEKARHDLMPPFALMRVAEVFTYGARKYGDRNWEKGMRWGRLFAAAMRHLIAWFAGEDFDRESHQHHLAHAACNLLMLLEYHETRNGTDDRPTTEGELPAAFGTGDQGEAEGTGEESGALGR